MDVSPIGMSGAQEITESEQNDLQAAALRMARRCRQIIQSCLREEEWPDADEEFSTVILEELESLIGAINRDVTTSHLATENSVPVPVHPVV